ncbi:hypothetical protein, partial [Enterobacter cloacae complex sp. IR5385]
LHQQKGMISLSPPTICNSAAAACIGFCASGIGAAFTNTLSAKIIKLLVGVFAVVMVIMIIIKLVNLLH